MGVKERKLEGTKLKRFVVDLPAAPEPTRRVQIRQIRHGRQRQLHKLNPYIIRATPSMFATFARRASSVTKTPLNLREASATLLPPIP